MKKQQTKQISKPRYIVHNNCDVRSHIINGKEELGKWLETYGEDFDTEIMTVSELTDKYTYKIAPVLSEIK